MRPASRLATVVASILLAACASGATPRDGDIVQSGNGQAPARGRPAFALPVSAAAIALNHSAELALSDNQRAALEVIRRGVDSANAPLLVQLDSLRPTQRPVNSKDMGPEEREQMRARRTAVGVVVGQMRDNAVAARARSFAVLSPEQRTRVEVLEAEAKKRSEDELNRVGRSDDADGVMRRRGSGRPPED